MAPRTPVWKWLLGLVALSIGATIAIPLYRYADRDDAPGGMVIALLVFVASGAVAVWIVRPVVESSRVNQPERR